LADIFVSYSRLDHDRVKPIVDRLSSLGYSVWWDKHLRAGEVFAEEIERQLDSARAVLTAWSDNARNSTWVCAESARGLDKQKFVQIRLDNAELPLPFNALPAADMRTTGEWGPLEDTLTRIVRDGAQPQPLTKLPSLGPLPTPTSAGAPKLVSIAMGATLAAYAGAVTAAYNGVMPSGQLQLALAGMIAVSAVCAALSAYRLVAVSRAGG